MVPVVFVLAWIWTAPPDLPVFHRFGLGWLALPAGLLIAAIGWGLWAYQPITHWRSAALAGDWSQAAQWAGESARRDPNFFFYQTEAGLLWAWQSEYQKDPAGLARARAALARSLELEPSVSWTWASLAVLDFRAGDLPAALAAIDRAIAISPTTPEYWLNQAYLYEQSGAAAQAESGYRQALVLAPGWASHPFWQTTPLRARVQGPVDLPAPESYAQQARAAITDRRLDDAARLVALGRIANEPALALEHAQALLASARGAPQPFENFIHRLDQARFNLDAGNNFFADAMIANRTGIGMQLAPGFLQLVPDIGQFAVLQQQIDALVRQGDCPAASRLAGLKQDLTYGFARPVPPPTLVCP